MSQKEYLRVLNCEIQKLNEVIDRKIIQGSDYRREARRHRKLLAQVRRDEARRSLVSLWAILNPLWRHLAEGCNLNRQTDEVLKAHGFLPEWEERVVKGGVPLYYGIMRQR